MSSKKKKIIEIVAGPNGSGKTTFAEAFFKLRNGDSRFINPDIIAAGLYFGNEAKAAFHAGRILLKSVEEGIKNGESFAFESTLSGKTWLKIINNAKAQGYEVVVYFLFLKDPKLNLKRIERRVQLGGHRVAKIDVLRRYPRSFLNFWNDYRLLCDDWFIFDNSGTSPKQIESKLSFDALSEEEQVKFAKTLFKIVKIK